MPGGHRLDLVITLSSFGQEGRRRDLPRGGFPRMALRDSRKPVQRPGWFEESFPFPRCSSRVLSPPWESSPTNPGNAIVAELVDALA
jgi:hypothetical protein